MIRADFDTAEILASAHCNACGWPVIFACCNWTWEPADGWDWWYYCANKGCANHHGEGVWQNQIEWVTFEARP